MVTKFYNHFKICSSGATAIEYALIAGGVAVAISVAVFAFGTEITGLFEYASERFNARPE